MRKESGLRSHLCVAAILNKHPLLTIPGCEDGTGWGNALFVPRHVACGIDRQHPNSDGNKVTVKSFLPLELHGKDRNGFGDTAFFAHITTHAEDRTYGVIDKVEGW